MSSIPIGTERMRPFVPAQDFDRSKHFYETLGFAVEPRVSMGRRLDETPKMDGPDSSTGSSQDAHAGEAGVTPAAPP